QKILKPFRSRQASSFYPNIIRAKCTLSVQVKLWEYIFMRFLLLTFLLLPVTAEARFLLQYGLNYSSQEDKSDAGDFEENRIFHKAFLGASVNGRKTLFFGWNINSWSSTLSQGSGNEDTYSMLEMGPRLQWYTNDNYNLYFSAEWNPYAK